MRSITASDTTAGFFVKRLSLFLFYTMVLLTCGQGVNASQKLVLGIYQYQSQTTVIQQYQGLANYLSNALPNHTIELRTFKANDLLEAITQQQVHLLLVNPNLYELLRAQIKLNGVTATLQRSYKGQMLDHLGGVIFTQKSHTDINQLSDLVDKRIAIPTKNNTGAYRVPLYEIFKAGINLNKLKFIEVGTHDSVIQAVLQGRADVGFVRTGILENWQDNNKLNLNKIKVINPKQTANYPQLLSTALYPEWPFIILPGLNENLNRNISVAIFALRAEHSAAIKAGISGFVTPRDYLPFQEVLRTLKLPPFDAQPQMTLQDLWRNYGHEIIIVALLLLSVIGLLLLSERRKRIIYQQEQRLFKKHQIDELLLELPKLAETYNENELLQYSLDKIERLTASSIGFIHAFDAKTEQIQLLAWSHNTLKTHCHMEEYSASYPLKEAGVWAEAARSKQPVLINDYIAYQGKHGLPEGHVALTRLISLPVLEHDEVVLIAGIGNKKTPYTQSDINLLQLILNEIWRILKGHRANQKILEQKNQFQRLLDDIGERYVVFSHSGDEGILNFVSASFIQVFEQPTQTVLQHPWFAKIDWLPESIEAAQQSVQALITGEKTTDTFILKFIAPQSKKVKTIQVQHHGVYQDNKLISIDGLVHDISEKIESEIRLKQAATVFECANEGILITNENNQIIRANKRIKDITGYTEQELLGQNPKILSSGHQDLAFYQKLWKTLTTTGTWEGELWNRRKSGELYPERLKISTVLDDNHNPAYYIALLSDITFEKEHQNELEKMAHFDALTNLPNRFLLSDRISQAIHTIQRSEEMIAIMFIDLDGFKAVNDIYGHQAGDFLLKTLANRILGSIREGDTVARIGGDEFVVVISSTKDQEEFAYIEQRILEETSNKVVFEDHTLQVSSSIGVVYYGHNYGKHLGSEQLLRLADQAMYQAKQQGKNTIQHYEWDNLQDKNELNQAIQQGLFELYYQPKVNCRTGEIISLEGLIRWNHPNKGLVPPYEFLPLIEQFGLMDKLSEFVIQDGINYLNHINQNRTNKIGISLNIQGNNLLHEEFVDYLIQCLTDNNTISPQQLTLEILESASLDKVEKIAHQINRLKTQGFKFAIDDFGTGHASLTYLKNLPVNEVKIDQEFIREIFNEPNSLSIIEAIISMAKAFNISVIAEGVETEQHIELLLQLGIESMQGYAIAKPMNRSQTDMWLKNWQANPIWQTLVEIAPEKKQLLKARLAHIAWVNKLQTMIVNGINEDLSYEYSPKNCEFGLWLLNSGKKTLSPQTFQTIEQLHQEIHQLAKQIIDSSLLGIKKDALEQLNKLKQKSTELNQFLQTIEI